MLKELHLLNFRCFQDHTVPLRPLTIVVGRNNVGKSTLIEALRLVSIVVNRYRNLNYSEAPEWTGLSRRFKGVRPSLRRFEFNQKGAFYQYADPPAEIDATFGSGEQVRVFVGPDAEIFAIIRTVNGTLVNSRSHANRAALPAVHILPQVGPLSLEETVLERDYVRSAVSSPLASSHFRNQLKVLSEHFNEFKRFSEETWHGLEIRELDYGRGYPGDPISLAVRSEAFVGEVGWMGHGLQMWLQTMWFLARSEGADTVILDEPDVYMHPDLQRRLIRFLSGRHPQAIVATHSVEIIADVEPENILVLDRSKTESRFAGSLPAVQKIVEQIGGVHNLHLARLWSSRRVLLVEGNELGILKRIHAILFPSPKEPLDQIPNMSIEGWNGWRHAVGSSMLMKNALGQQIVCYCILDLDYHTESEIEKRHKEAAERDVQLHIWRRKEVENYLLVPDAICRVINSRSLRAQTTAKQVRRKLDEIVAEFRQASLEALVTEYHSSDRASGVAPAMRRADARLAEAWKTFEGRISAVPGKDVISRLSAWSAKEFGVSLSPIAIASLMSADEIAMEVRHILEDIESASPFGTSARAKTGKGA